MTTKKQEDPVKKLSKLINQSSFKFNKGINSFWGIELLPEIVTELIFIGNSCPNKEQ